MPSFALARARPPSRVSVVRSLLSSPLTAPRRPWQVLRASPRSTGRGMSTNCRHCRQAWRARTTSALRGHCWRCQLLVPLTSVAQAHPRPGATRRGRRAAGARGRALEPCQRGTAGGRRRAGRGSAGRRAGGGAAGVGFLVWSLLTSSGRPAGARRRRVQRRRGPKAGAPSPSRLAPGVGRASRRRGRGGERRLASSGRAPRCVRVVASAAPEHAARGAVTCGGAGFDMAALMRPGGPSLGNCRRAKLAAQRRM